MRLARRKFLKNVATGLFVPVFPAIVKGQAFSFGDQAFMAQAAAAGCNPLITSWASRVVANGGAAPSAGTQTALCTFANGLITDSLDTQMIAWNALVPDSLTAAITPQLVGGGNDPWTNNGPFVSGDLTINGLIGNGSSKYLDPNLLPSNIYNSVNEGGITIYAFSNPNATNCDAGAADSGGANSLALQMYLGTTYWDCYNSSGGRISASNSGFTGYVSGNRIASNNTAIYEANSGTAHNALVTGATNGGALPGIAIVFFALNQTGTGVNTFSNQRLSFCALHHGLTSGQSALFYARIQQLRTDLGGGFV